MAHEVLDCRLLALGQGGPFLSLLHLCGQTLTHLGIEPAQSPLGVLQEEKKITEWRRLRASFQWEDMAELGFGTVVDDDVMV